MTSDTTQSPGPPDDDLLAAELVMALLEGDELRAAQQRAATDPAFAAQVAGWQERLVAVTDTIDPVAPPRRLRKRLLRQLFGAQPVPLSDRLWVWRGLALAAVILAAFLGIRQLGPEQTPAGPLYATQLTGEVVPLRVLAVLDPQRGDIVLSRLEGAAGAGRTFELWAIVPDAAPVSLGLLPGGAQMRVTLPDALRARVSEITLAISDEPTGGSPTGAPTGAVLAASAVTEL
jgi:anti-sigma-K factor RskA